MMVTSRIVLVKSITEQRERECSAGITSSQRRSNKDDSMKNWEAQMDKINAMARFIKWMMVIIIIFTGFLLGLALWRLW